jgi:hypothetical protein
MLKVVGDSMVDAAIADGDWVVVRQQPNAENGDIVAAMIDGEATVKTYKRRDGKVWLLPHNAAYQPDPRGQRRRPRPRRHGPAQGVRPPRSGRVVHQLAACLLDLERGRIARPSSRCR